MSLSINIQIPDEALARIVRKVVQEYLDAPKAPEPELAPEPCLDEPRPALSRPLSVHAQRCPTCNSGRREGPLREDRGVPCPDPWHTMGSGVSLVNNEGGKLSLTPQGLAYARQVAAMEFEGRSEARGTVVLPGDHADLLAKELQNYGEKILNSYDVQHLGGPAYEVGARKMLESLVGYVTGERL